MKSTTNQSPCNASLQYPCLMLSKHTGSIVLFIKPAVGTLVFVGKNTAHTMGKYKEGWWMGNFIPYKGSVCLEND